jgi:DNA-directed RNA polymerase subunit RPC12/RpoP
VRIVIANLHHALAPPAVRTIAACADCGARVTWQIAPARGSLIVCAWCGYRRHQLRAGRPDPGPGPERPGRRT